MDVEGVIFDLDGTLIHTIEDLCDAANAVLANHGYAQHPQEDYLKWIGNGAVKFIELSLGNGTDPDRLREYVAEFKEIYGLNLHNKSRVYEGIPEVLNAYREQGIILTILSNKPHKLTIQVAEHHLSDWPFRAVFGQREEVPRKPDPAAALEIAGLMGVAPEKILFVGDSQGDIVTARAAGMIPVGVTWGYGEPEPTTREGEVHMVDRPIELIKLLSIN